MLKVRDLDTGYGDIQVLWKNSLSSHGGEIVSLLGPNGAGKSTLLNTVAGLVKPWSGSVEFKSEPITHLPAHERVDRGLSLVLERRRLFPMMSVQENLLVGAHIGRAREVRRESLDWVLELFPVLGDKFSAQGQTLSGGQQQQLAIARGLMSRPSLLMVDEPFIGLSPQVIESVIDAFRTLRTAGISVLLIEQHLDVVLRFSDRVVVMVDGRVALDSASAAGGLRDIIMGLYVDGASDDMGLTR